VQVALDSFRSNLTRARALSGLYTALQNATTPALDLSDLLRAQIVLGVSAFDHLVHELTRLGALEIFAATRLATPAYSRFEISLESVTALLTNPTDPSPFDQEIRVRHSWLSFQRPDKVADALRIVSDKSLWIEVAPKLHMPVVDLKTRLNSIIDRRNQIAHEADLDPTDPTLQTRWPIKRTDTDSAIDFLEQVGDAIFQVIT
jgi:hypothetical protein